MPKKNTLYKGTLSREGAIALIDSSKDLSYYDLSRIDLGDLNISNCDLSNSRLDFGWFKRSKFDNCNLHNTTFRYSMLDNTSFLSVKGFNSVFNLLGLIPRSSASP